MVSFWTDHPRLQIALIALLAIVAIGWPAWDLYNELRVAEIEQPIVARMQDTGTIIVGLDELMSVAVHRAAVSGDPNWEVAYRTAEPKLTRAINEGRRLQVDAIPGAGAARMELANNALVAMEHQAFEAIRDGRQIDAKRLLSTDSHEFQREQFVEGMAEYNAFQSRADALLHASFVHSKRNDALKMIVSIVLLMLAITMMIRITRRWQASIKQSNQRLNAQALELQGFNQQLDLKVRERTKELNDSAIASLNMMEDAVHQREQTERAQERLNYLAYYDALTGLANQSLFLQRVQAKLLPAVGDQLLVVFVLDIMHFKSINDAFGREAGDDLLKQITERMISVGGGDPDRFARIGADRFGVVATELTSAEHAGRYTNERLDAIFHPPFRIADTDVHASVKAGIAMFPFDGADAEILLHHAEAALKKAKSTGELFLFFNQAMTERVAERLSLEHRLRQAIDNEEFVLHYQPKVSLITGKLTGAEALIRWNDPTTGLVPPNMFIPILEDTGLIQEVGRWAMRKAMGDYLRWRDLGMPAVPIAVNVSALQLRNRDFIVDVRQVVEMDMRAAEGLELEITESMIMDDIKQAVATLHEIRAMGVRIAIDDFGTGFSSLAYLAKLPIDTLKIDRAFVNDLTTGPQGIALVNTIITLANSLQLKVVAEGVETEEQLLMLKSLHCDEMQGYLFSKPIPHDLFESRYLTAAAAA